MNRNRKTKIAFTLIELLVVIAIIGILSALIVVGMNSTTEKARIAKSQVFANSLRNSLMGNLISEWKFDVINSPAANQTPDLWGLNTGTLTDTSGACSFVAPLKCPQLVTSGCPSGNCLSFDGTDDYVDCGSGAALNFSNNIFTMSAWVKTNNSGAWKWIYQFGEHASNKDRTLAINASDKAILYVYGTNAIGTTSITNNAWHYLAGTSDGTTTKIYVDGVSENSAVPTFSTYTYNGARIGKNNAVAAYFFNGTIDDVRVFDVAMPTSQIQQDYFAGLNKLFAKNQITQTDYQQRLAELSNNYVKE